MLRQTRRIDDDEVGIAGKQSGDGIGRAAVRHDEDVDILLQPEQLIDDSRTAGRRVVFPGIPAQQVHEFRQRSRGDLRRVHDDEIRVLAEHGHGLQVPDRIDGRLLYIAGFTVAALELNRIV